MFEHMLGILEILKDNKYYQISSYIGLLLSQSCPDNIH